MLKSRRAIRGIFFLRSKSMPGLGWCLCGARGKEGWKWQSLFCAQPSLSPSPSAAVQSPGSSDFPGSPSAAVEPPSRPPSSPLRCSQALESAQKKWEWVQIFPEQKLSVPIARICSDFVSSMLSVILFLILFILSRLKNAEFSRFYAGKNNSWELQMGMSSNIPNHFLLSVPRARICSDFVSPVLSILLFKNYLFCLKNAEFSRFYELVLCRE